MLRHVLCVFPYRVGIGARKRFYPPLGLEIIAAMLEPHCRSIDIVDFRRETKRTVDFLRPDTDLVCFSVNWDRERERVCDEIRSVPRHIRTVVGGRHATEDPERWLSECPNIDILVRGHGEEAAKEIMQDRPLKEIAGISYRLNGKLVHTPVRECGALPDDFGPNRRLRRYVYTLDSPDISTGLAFDTIASSVGCPHNCTFCSFNRNPWGARRRWLARSPEAVVRELEGMDAKLVAFVDDNFAHDMDRVGAICDLIESRLHTRGIRKSYIVNGRLEMAKRPDVLWKMERAGFKVLLVGIESAQDKTLRAMRKGFDTRQAREYFRVLRRTRMIIHGYFIVGNIGESEREMLQIVPFARELGVDSVSLCMLRNERYSGLEELVQATPGYHIAPDEGIFSDRYSQEHLRRVRDRIFKGFYTPWQILHIVRKALKNGMVTPRMLSRLPIFLLHALAGRFYPARGERPVMGT